MKVAVDVTELAPGDPGGVRRALWLLLDALHKHAPEIELEAIAPNAVEVPEGVSMTATGGPSRPRWWRRSRALRRALSRFDLFHSPVTAIPDGPVVTATIHELPFMADTFGRVMAQSYWVTRALTRCGALVVPSHATLQQLRDMHPAAIRKTYVVPHPAPPTPDHEQHDHDGSLLFVGRLDARKRVRKLLEAGCDIKLAGPQRKKDRIRIERQAQKLGVRDRIAFLGTVSEEHLDELYCRACAVAVVSSSEGFGFPVLEALSRGVPVITTAGTGATEVAGELAIVAEPHEMPEAVARARDPEHRDFVRRRGPGRALEFTLERTARGYVEVFARALDG